MEVLFIIYSNLKIEIDKWIMCADDDIRDADNQTQYIEKGIDKKIQNV